MVELKIDVRGRKVSDHLWQSLVSCKSAKEFAIYMANAEERGRKAGERFHQALADRDPITAEIFRKIAEEEVAHIALASKYYPETPLTPKRSLKADWQQVCTIWPPWNRVPHRGPEV